MAMGVKFFSLVTSASPINVPAQVIHVNSILGSNSLIFVGLKLKLIKYRTSSKNYEIQTARVIYFSLRTVKFSLNLELFNFSLSGPGRVLHTTLDTYL